MTAVPDPADVAIMLSRAARELRLHNEEYEHRTDPAFIEQIERAGRETAHTTPIWPQVTFSDESVALDEQSIEVLPRVFR